MAARKKMCWALLAVALSLPAPASRAEGPPRVGVVIAERKAVAAPADYAGRVGAAEKVEVRTRIKGFVRAVRFKDGQPVQAGDPLYELEPELYAADVALAEGALARAEASRLLASLQYKRAQEMFSRQVGTGVQRDQAAAADQEAAAAIVSARAHVDIAKINLGYATITAPITGRIGLSAVTAGNAVGPESGPLATLVAPDPARVSFQMSARDFARLSREKGDLGFSATLTLPDGSAYGEKGRVDFVDVKADPATETITLRATFPNPRERLRDGEVLRVKLEGADRPGTAVVVPRAAVLADRQGRFVFVVDGGKVFAKRVKTGGEAGDDIWVDEGLSGGEAVVVDGLADILSGAPVTAAARGGT